MSTDPTTNTQQRIKKAQKRPNKSQMRAAQTRSDHTAAAPIATTSSIVEPVAPSAIQTQVLSPAQKRAIQRGGVARGSGLPTGVTALTRDEEMEMIREDMNRLLIIAGILLVGMLALLFVID